MSEHSPLPWRYDPQTRNILAADGSIVCRNGDSVHGYPEIAERIVQSVNTHGLLVGALRFAIDRLHQEGYDNTIKDGGCPSTMATLRTVLDKATGKETP